MIRRKLLKAFYSEKKQQFDISKVPDIYDSAKYDAIHNSELGLDLKPLYTVRPQETMARHAQLAAATIEFTGFANMWSAGTCASQLDYLMQPCCLALALLQGSCPQINHYF